jgi:D-alanyl-D-alanine carboxypeptidase/D-alanyl-D-alanine-endopeptidase (penicillin-binding protein 4)
LRVVLFALLLASVAASAQPAPLPDLAAAARSILGADQGVYIEAANGTVLLAQAASVPVHPASVSKVPTTLALLRKLGPEHRFITTFTAKGRVIDGTLHGDLIVTSDGDPSLVDEDALLVAERLRQAGISRVSGTLQLKGPLTFDWKIDSDGSSLRRAMSGLTPPAALAAVRALAVLDATAATAGSAGGSTSPLAIAGPQAMVAATGTLAPLGIHFVSAPALAGDTVSIAGAAPPAGVIELTGEHPLVVHRSQPLLPLVKSLNDYSNNIFAPFAAAAGGAPAVETLARSVVPEAMRAEITLGDGAGADPTNRLSPRAAVKLLRVLEQELAKTDHALFDILPVAGVDDGTLHERLDGPGEAGHVLGKTGTFGDYGASALIGALHTTDLGTVYFAILNHNVPVPQARHRQDRFVRFLLTQLHTVPWNYQRDLRPAITRAEVSIMVP